MPPIGGNWIQYGRFQPGIENFQPFLQKNYSSQISLNNSDTFPGAVSATRVSTLLEQDMSKAVVCELQRRTEPIAEV